MTNYADSTYYTVTYLAGKEAVIDTASFAYYARKATQIIKQHTFGNVNEASIPDDVKMCCCEVAEYVFKKENADQSTEASIKGLTSETSGGHSASYETTEAREQSHNNIIKGIIYNWLAMTGLLYRGCC
jgi:hypothetical protein